MNDKNPSPRNQAANPHRTKRRRPLGLAILALVVIGLVLATVVWGERLQSLFLGGPPAVSLGIEDRTSPEQLAAHRQQALAQLNGYAWVDEEAGTARIPIDRAMALLAANGLPVGTEAPAEGGAEESDTEESSQEAEAPAPVASLEDVNYEDHVLPIFEDRCGECHGADDPEEGLELTRYRTALMGSMHGPVIVPGDPDDSYLVEMIVTGQMPKRGDPLPEAEIETIIAWIQAGAPEQGTATDEGATDDQATAEDEATADEAAPEEEATAEPIDLANVSYQEHVLPIFEERCGECHGADDPEEGLELTRYRTALMGSMHGPVIVPGDPDDSYLVELIATGQMPKRGDPLPEAEIETIIAWIQAGAPDN